jgi:hypothetical protein
MFVETGEPEMPRQAFCKVATAIFGLVALAHVGRLALGLPVQVGATAIPLWVSWLGLFVSAGLSLWGFRSGR